MGDYRASTWASGEVDRCSTLVSDLFVPAVPGLRLGQDSARKFELRPTPEPFYYACRHRPPSAHARADKVMLARIKTVHISSRQSYGPPRVQAELQAAGERHGRKRIARLMRAAGLVGAKRRRGGAARSRHGATSKPGPRRIWSTATSRQPARTSCGSPTSPTSRPRRGFSIWL